MIQETNENTIKFAFNIAIIIESKEDLQNIFMEMVI